MSDRNLKNFKMEKKGTALIVFLNNPPVNTLNESFFFELQQIIEQVNSDVEIISVIITTALPKVFTVGADVKELLKKYGSTRKMNNAIENLNLGHKTFDMIEKSPKPFIIAYKGLSYGGGIELGCACDIRIASEDTVFSMPETRIAFIPGYGGTQRLPRLVGCGAAKRIIFTGEPIKAEEALRIGLIDEITPNDKLLERSIEIAECIAKGSPRSLAFIKKSVNEGIDLHINQALEREKMYFMENILTLEWSEGLSAFIDKKDPKFKRIGKVKENVEIKLV